MSGRGPQSLGDRPKRLELLGSLIRDRQYSAIIGSKYNKYSFTSSNNKTRNIREGGDSHASRILLSCGSFPGTCSTVVLGTPAVRDNAWIYILTQIRQSN